MTAPLLKHGPVKIGQKFLWNVSTNSGFCLLILLIFELGTRTGQKHGQTGKTRIAAYQTADDRAIIARYECNGIYYRPPNN